MICLLYNLNCLNIGAYLHNEAFERYILKITTLGIYLKFKQNIASTNYSRKNVM